MGSWRPSFDGRVLCRALYSLFECDLLLTVDLKKQPLAIACAEPMRSWLLGDALGYFLIFDDRLITKIFNEAISSEIDRLRKPD